MTDWGINYDALQIDKTYPTGLVQVEIRDREPHYDIVANSAYDFIDGNLLPEIKANSRTEGILYHGSMGIRNPISRKALQTFKANHQGKIFVDVNLRDPSWQRETLFPLLNDANWVKINEHELAILHPESSNIESEIEGFCQKFDLDKVIVTLGEKGAIAWDKQQFTYVNATANIKVVDTVGAGDAFASVFLLGLSNQWAIAKTLVLGGGSVPIIFDCLACRRLNVRESKWLVNLSRRVLERAQAFAGEMVMRRGATTSDRDFYQSFKQQWNYSLSSE